MRDLKRYWQEVRALQKTLPEYVWLVSLEDELRDLVGGCLVQVIGEIAAQLLYGKTHRLATDEEIRAKAEEESAANRSAAQDELRRRGIAVVAVSDQLKH